MAPAAKHALLSPSSAHRWLACPPSARLTEHIPDTASPYAAEGTRAHALCEETLTRSLQAWGDGEPEGCPAASAACDGPDREPEEMIAAAQTYVDFIHELWMGSVAEPAVYVEQPVRMDTWVPECSGTCDCLLITDDCLHIIDFKYGKGVAVSAEDNPQLKLYALGALQLFAGIYEIDTVRMSIVQPRIKAEADTWELSTDDLLRWAKEVLAPAAKLAWKGEGNLNPGQSQCRFCKAYPTCRAWASKYGPLAGFTPEPAQLTPAELGEWLAKVQDLAAYAKDLQEYALQQTLDGKPVPGWKAVEGVSKRTWADEAAAFDAMQARMDIPVDVLYKPREHITLTEAEKLLGKKSFAETCGQYITRKPGAPKLVPASDKRPAITKADGFKDLDAPNGQG